LIDAHLAWSRGEYRRRKEAMRDALAEHFSDIAHWTDPEGGFFLWVTFSGGGPDGPVDTERLFETALAEGVAYIPGNAFSLQRRFPHALRVCFASTPPDRIREGVARLRAAVDRLPDVATASA